MSLTDVAKAPASYGTDDDDDHDAIRYQLDDDELELVEEIAQARAQSYCDGRTTDENYSNGDTVDAHLLGVCAEVALDALYESFEIDRSVSAAGDGGLDGHLVLNDKERSIDVKAREWSGPDLELLVRDDHVESRSVTPDGYLLAWADVESGVVELQGWIGADELLVESNLEECRSSYDDWRNYVMLASDLESMPSPTTDVESETTERR
jgi:hypothetical protein